MDKSQEENIRKFRCCITDCMSYQNGTVFIISIANLLAEGLDSDEISLIGNFLESVGQILEYIASKKDLIK